MSHNLVHKWKYQSTSCSLLVFLFCNTSPWRLSNFFITTLATLKIKHFNALLTLKVIQGGHWNCRAKSGLNNQQKSVSTLSMIGWKHAGGTRWLGALVKESIRAVLDLQTNSFVCFTLSRHPRLIFIMRGLPHRTEHEKITTCTPWSCKGLSPSSSSTLLSKGGICF